MDGSGNVYVADTNNNRIQKFDSAGTFITKWGANGGDGTSGSGDGQFKGPYGVAVDGSGNVYVADLINNRIQKFDSTGTYLLQWGSNGTGNGQFDSPIGVAVDGSGNVYVADSVNNRIQKFSQSAFSLDDDGSEPLTGLAAGPQWVSEDVPTGWTLDDIDCGGATTETTSDGVMVTLATGDDVTCTFTNLQDAPASFCPANDANVGYLLTDVLGAGQGSPTRAQRTRKVVIPNWQDVDSLYGQLAAVDVGVMKYVRFRYPNGTKEQIKPPTSLAYQPWAVSWWGSDLTPSRYIKGQFFWGKKGNKAPRAFVLWPTYNTTEEYADVLMVFDETTKTMCPGNPAGFPPRRRPSPFPKRRPTAQT
ncbi:MAG: hypothetical protein R3C44_23235 [Chloroflexota bacterium]